MDRASSTPAGFRCLACGGAAGRPLFVKETIALARCRACGFVQQDPLPDAAAVAAMYADDPHYGDELRRSEAIFQARDRALVAELAGHGAAGPLLDVGAGAGLILRAAQERGWEAVGIEISQPSAEKIRADLHAEVHEVPLEDAPLAAGRFGAVVFSHSLEHVRNPVATLKRAALLLRPGGLLHVAVPNWRSFKRTLAGRHVPWIYPHHVTYFERRTLDRVVRAGGFAPLAWSYRDYPGADDAFVLAWLRRLRLDAPLRRWLRMGERPLESLIADDVRVDCPVWRFRVLLGFARSVHRCWPERPLRRLGRSDELRLTARLAVPAAPC